MWGVRMKQLQVLLFTLTMFVGSTAHALDQDVQVDLLMAKIINAEKEGRAADALPSMAKLESMEPTLSEPLPEEFHYLYITTLDKAGDHANSLRRANIYIEKFGRRGKNYSKVIDIMSRLEEEADKNAKADKARIEAEALALKSKCKEILIRYCKTYRERHQAGKDFWNTTGEEHHSQREKMNELDHVLADMEERVGHECRYGNVGEDLEDIGSNEECLPKEQRNDAHWFGR
jgi:hypothetical protein